MKNSWTKVKETSRTYFHNNGKVRIENPSAIFISPSRTHYISTNDDTTRTIVPWPFNAIELEVEKSSDWVYPEPRKDV